MGPVSTELAPFFGWGSIEEELLVFADFLTDVQREKAPWLTGGGEQMDLARPEAGQGGGDGGRREEEREKREENGR